MAGQVGRVARRMWSSCSSAARYTVTGSCASSSSSAAAAGRPLPCNFSSPQQQLFGRRRLSVHFTRLPGEIVSISSMMPRHNATAAARLVSKLSSDLTPEIEGLDS